MIDTDVKKLDSLLDQLEELSRNQIRKREYDISLEVKKIENQVNEIEHKYPLSKMTKDLRIMVREAKEFIQDIKNSLYDYSVIDAAIEDMNPGHEPDMDD